MTEIEARLAQLERDVADLRATQALRGVLSRYAVAVDEADPEGLRKLFTPDAAVRIPAWQVDVHGIDAVLDFYHDYWARFSKPRRYFANDTTTISGDRAQVFMYWHVTQERAGTPVLGWGTYDWEFARIDGDWRIAAVLIDIRAMTTLAAGWAGEQAFTDV